MRYIDRADAGRHLAQRLRQLRGADVVVLGLPRGGVPVAVEVAADLGAALDVIVVRKLGVPFQPEYGFGAVAERGVRIVDEHVVRVAGLGEREVAAVETRERAELDRRTGQFRADRPRVPLDDRTVIVVDDGMATGSTARAACQAARAHGARRVVLAVPVGSPDAIAAVRRDADEVVCLETPDPFHAIGEWYGDFPLTSDDEVVALLDKSVSRPSIAPAKDYADQVMAQSGRTRLPGYLTVPDRATGIVVFANSSGSCRRNPRNRLVAHAFHQAGLGTLLVDLLAPHEELSRAYVFNVRLLAARLTGVTTWLREQPVAPHLPIGYFGTGPGVAAALFAATEPAADIAAIVCRSGRPDLAGGRLRSVCAPTLLIVGGHDEPVYEINRQAQERLVCPNRLAVIPGATHLFEEPGALERVAELARDWFTRHLEPGRRA